MRNDRYELENKNGGGNNKKNFQIKNIQVKDNTRKILNSQKIELEETAKEKDDGRSISAQGSTRSKGTKKEGK